MIRTLIAVLFVAALFTTASAEAQDYVYGPQYAPVGPAPASVAPYDWRQDIRSMHILDRPYRFGHVYGNTVRRRHYR